MSIVVFLLLSDSTLAFVPKHVGRVPTSAAASSFVESAINEEQSSSTFPQSNHFDEDIRGRSALTDHILDEVRSPPGSLSKDIIDVSVVYGVWCGLGTSWALDCESNRFLHLSFADRLPFH